MLLRIGVDAMREPARGFVLIGPHERAGNGPPVVRLRKTVTENRGGEDELVSETESWLAAGDTIVLTFRDYLVDQERDVHHETMTKVVYEVLGDE